MSNQLLKLGFICLVLLLPGCSRPHIVLDRAIVLNATTHKIANVKVIHQPTRKSGEVNAILPQMTLDIGFSGKPMLANKAMVRWRDGEGVERKEHLELPYDRALAEAGESMNLVYVIHQSGTVTAHLERSK